MKPRNLRHRLEKTAKLLVIVQKHLPNVTCRFEDDKGEHGLLTIRLPQGEDLSALGDDLESRGFAFTRVHRAFQGVITYRGIKTDQPVVVIDVEVRADRLERIEEVEAEPYSFKA